LVRSLLLAIPAINSLFVIIASFYSVLDLKPLFAPHFDKVHSVNEYPETAQK